MSTPPPDNPTPELKSRLLLSGSWIRVALLLFPFVFVISACATTQPAQIQKLPTLMPTPTMQLESTDAQRVAQLFLTAWVNNNFEEMYNLISFNSQEAYPFDDFRAAYETAHETMTLEALTIEPRTMQRQGNMFSYNYEVTFHTRIPGDFTDNRDMYLVTDPTVNTWRVAWSPANIFTEMADGAQLIFDKRIPGRANIYDRNGEVLADQHGIIVPINIIPEKMPRPEECLPLLATVLDKPQEDVQARIDAGQLNWEIEIGLIETTAYTQYSKALEDACRATFSQRATRRYLRGALMPHILGNVGYPDESEIPDLLLVGFEKDTIIGKSGIEGSWDETLHGRPGGRLYLQAPGGERIRVLAEAASKGSESLWLTIDLNFQEYVTQVIGEAYGNASGSWGQTSKGGAAVVLDVNTGEILAMVSWPNFEGNALNPFPAVGRSVADDIIEKLAEDESVPQINRVTQGVYPSGSTMKPITSLAVLDSGVYVEETNYFCSGIWQRDNDVRYDWLAGGHGRVTVQSAITTSCNPFFYEAGFQLNLAGPDLLPSYLKRVGLGTPTGLTDLVESVGTIGSPDWLRTTRGLTWTSSNAVSMAIGQGEVEVTPLQMARAYAAIANGGTLYKPQIVREVGIFDQRRFTAEPVVVGTLDINEWVLDIVRKGMCEVTSTRGGTASHIFRDSPLLNLGVCGKTGTAEDPKVGIPHSWFISYAPQENPEIAMAVIIENSGDGSAIAAPITRRIMEYYFFDIK